MWLAVWYSGYTSTDGLASYYTYLEMKGRYFGLSSLVRRLEFELLQFKILSQNQNRFLIIQLPL